MGEIMRRTVLLAAASLLSGGVFAGAGGGEVVIPAGRFRTGGLVLKSGVTLRSFCSGCRDFFRLGQNSGAGRFEKGSGEGLF